MCWVLGAGRWVCPARLRVIQRSKSMSKRKPDCKMSGGLTVSREFRINSRKTWQRSVTSKPALKWVGWRSGEEWLHALVLYLHRLIAHRCQKKRDPAQGWRRQEHRCFTTHPDHDRTRLREGPQSETGKKQKKADEWMFSFDFSLYRTKSQQPIIQSRRYYELWHGEMMVWEWW